MQSVRLCRPSMLLSACTCAVDDSINYLMYFRKISLGQRRVERSVDQLSIVCVFVRVCVCLRARALARMRLTGRAG